MLARNIEAESSPHRSRRSHGRLTTTPPPRTPRPRRNTAGGAFPCTHTLTANDAAIIKLSVRAHCRCPMIRWASSSARSLCAAGHDRSARISRFVTHLMIKFRPAA